MVQHSFDTVFLAYSITVLGLPEALRRFIEPLSRRLHVQEVIDVDQCASQHYFGHEPAVLRLADDAVLLNLIPIRHLEYANGLKSL